MNKNLNILWAVGLLTVVAGVVFFIFQNKDGNVVPDQHTSTVGDIGGTPVQTPPAASQMITVTNPKEGDVLDATNGFALSGQAVGNWFFEATAPVTIYGKDDTVLYKSYVTAQGEWMTTDFVPFSAVIPPFLINGQTEGYVEFQNSNPSDNEGFRRSLRVDVRFSPQATQNIKLYFGNTKMNPGALDCSKVFAVTRTEPKTVGIASLSLRALLAGPIDDETNLGYISAFSGRRGELKSLDIKNGVATADFSVLPSGGSCLVSEARAQIEQTLKQFSSVKTVKILLNGSESEALQP